MENQANIFEQKNGDFQKPLIHSLVENVYDMQGVRIAMGNRLVANLRSMGLGYNSTVKTKLIGVLGSAFFVPARMPSILRFTTITRIG